MHGYEFWCRGSFRLHWAYRGQPPGPFTTGSYLNPPDACVAWLTESGDTTVEVDGELSKATSGQWIFPRPGHGTQFHSGRMLSIRFEAVWPDQRPIFYQNRNLILDSHKTAGFTESALTLQSAVDRHYGSRCRMLPHAEETLTAESFVQLQSILLTFVREWVRLLGDAVDLTSPKLDDPRVDQIYQKVRNWPLHVMPNRVELARSVGLSVSQMNRLYRQHYGRTPSAMLDRQRAEWALHQVAEGRLQIKEIGLSLGYTNASQFTSWFRRHAGCSPSAYRQASDSLSPL